MPKEENLYSKYKYIWEQVDNTMDSLFSYIQNNPVIEMDSYGNITVANTKDKDTCPVFCCHLDTVHHKEPNLELVANDVLLSFNEAGVGGDDKCGIVACLELLQRVPCKCIFFRDEERGCKGSKQYNAKSLSNNAFCIEIDRKGGTDLIFSASGGIMCSEEFQERVKKFFPHGEAANGFLTDVCVLDDAEINMMNLSAGYYKPHTDKEYVVLSELSLNIACLEALAKDIIANPLKNKTYTRSKYVTQGYNTQSYWSKGRENYGTGYGGQPNMFPNTIVDEDPIEGYDRESTDPGFEDYEALQLGKRKRQQYKKKM